MRQLSNPKPARLKSIPIRRLLICLTVVLASCANAADEDRTEEVVSGWRLQIDNDALATGGRDRNYTGGIVFSRSGIKAVESVFSIDSWLGTIDRLFRLHPSSAETITHSMQGGLLVFTPENVSTHTPKFDDHPYSNLIFLSNSRQSLLAEEQSVIRSSLLVGIFGTGTAEALQKGLHSVLDVEEANGWDNQISDGGELTFRYSLSKSSIFASNHTKGFLREFPWK
jgi:hypothetical protein